MDKADAVIVGGGFFGACVATYLSRVRRLRRVILLEQEAGLLQHASRNNQARIHNGYHYPRSFTTAYRSRLSLPRFMKDWPDVVHASTEKIYAISRRQSFVSATQFKRFCSGIGASLRPARPDVRALFAPAMVEEIFTAEEYFFDGQQLASSVAAELEGADVEVRVNTRVTGLYRHGSAIEVRSRRGEQTLSLEAPLVFNCTYAGLNQFGGDFRPTRRQLKHELTELSLVKVPEPLRNLGITLMDGPFFSLVPYPALPGLHTLTHVRYTPHQSWSDAPGRDPYQTLRQHDGSSHVHRMMLDAARYVPLIRDSQVEGALFEIKTVLARNEIDDGRPILFERHDELPGLYSILGGKIDNVYEVFARLDEEPLPTHVKQATAWTS